LVAAAAALAMLPSAAQDASRALADGAREKIEAIVAAGERPRAAPLRTMLTEAEINAYLAVHGPEVLPSAVARPEVRIGADGRVQARSTVDLDAVRKARPRGWRDPLAYVAGSVEVVASGRIEADRGVGRAEIESATVGGVTVPTVVVRELVQFFTTNDERPGGIDLAQPFEMPASIQRVIVERGRVTIVQ